MGDEREAETDGEVHWVELALLLQERDPFAHEALD